MKFAMLIEANEPKSGLTALPFFDVRMPSVRGILEGVTEGGIWTLGHEVSIR